MCTLCARRPTNFCSIHYFTLNRRIAISVSACLSAYLRNTGQSYLEAYTLAVATTRSSCDHDVIRFVLPVGWLCSRVVSVLDSGAEGPGFKSQPRRCQVTVLGKLLTPIVPLFTKQQNW